MLDEIINGDAYELIKNIPDKSVDLIVTDPPYEFGNLLYQINLIKRKFPYYKGVDWGKKYTMEELGL